MALSPRGRGWCLPHHLLHLLLQHQHHLPRQLQLQHCFLPQFPHRQSKRFPWRRHFLWLRLLSPTSWRTPPSASTPYVSAGGGPPSTASTAEAAPGENEGVHNSPIIITESLSSPPRQEAPTQQPTQEGGGENQQQAPPVLPQADLSLAVRRVWEPFSAKLKMMAEDFPSIISKAVETSSKISRMTSSCSKRRIAQ